MYDSLNMDMIASLLGPYKKEVILHEEKRIIHSALILQGNPACYSEDLLYVCRASEINKINMIDCPANFVCLYDEDMKSEHMNNTHINIIVISGPIDLSDLYSMIQTSIEKNHRLREWYISLTKFLFSNESLQIIVDMASTFLGNPIMIFDSSYKLLTYSKTCSVDQWVWHQFVDTKSIPYSVLEQIKSSEFAKVYNTDLPILINKKNEFIPSDTWCCRLDVLGKPVGHVSLIGYSQSLKPEDSEYVKILGGVIAQVLQKNSLMQNAKFLKLESFLTDLFDGKITDELQIEDRLKTLGLTFKKNLYVLTVRGIPGSENRISLSFIRHMLNNEIVDCKSIIHKDDIVIIINRGRSNLLLQNDLKSISKLLKEYQLISGLSRCFSDISKLNLYYNQSIKAIDLGMRLGNMKEIFHYSDYYIYDAIDIALKSEGYNILNSPSLFELIEYDRINNTELTQSLFAYLSCNCNLLESSEKLNIHRNSMDYRIKKIQEILNIDLKNADTVFSLNFSFKILIYKKIFKPDPEK